MVQAAFTQLLLFYNRFLELCKRQVGAAGTITLACSRAALHCDAVSKQALSSIMLQAGRWLLPLPAMLETGCAVPTAHPTCRVRRGWR